MRDHHLNLLPPGQNTLIYLYFSLYFCICLCILVLSCLSYPFALPMFFYLFFQTSYFYFVFCLCVCHSLLSLCLLWWIQYRWQGQQAFGGATQTFKLDWTRNLWTHFVRNIKLYSLNIILPLDVWFCKARNIVDIIHEYMNIPKIYTKFRKIFIFQE